jgi:putative ABC transport system permease protein
MKARVLTKVAAQSILKNKMRTLLTMLGVIIGVGAVIVMVAIARAKRRIAEQVASLGTNMIVVTPERCGLWREPGSDSERAHARDVAS